MTISKPTLWEVDNGAVYCTDHLGISARSSGRDLSGQPIQEMQPEEDIHWRCETCGRDHEEVAAGAPHHEACDDSMCAGFRGVPDGHYIKCSKKVSGLADAALPLSEEDWGSERQIKAEVAFQDALAEVLGEKAWEEFATFTFKATTEEMVAKGLALLAVSGLDTVIEQLRDLKSECIKDRKELQAEDAKTKRYDEDGHRLTNCCGAFSTFFEDGTLYCKKCYTEVSPGEGDGSDDLPPTA